MDKIGSAAFTYHEYVLFRDDANRMLTAAASIRAPKEHEPGAMPGSHFIRSIRASSKQLQDALRLRVGLSQHCSRRLYEDLVLDKTRRL